MADDRRPSDDPQEPADPAGVSQPEAGEDTRATGLPPKLERWRRRSAAGAIMTGFAFGLQQVFEPERKEPSIMLETSGTPPTDLPVDAELDGLAARRSVVRIRPWLLERTGGTEAADGTPAAATPPTGDPVPDAGRPTDRGTDRGEAGPDHGPTGRGPTGSAPTGSASTDGHEPTGAGPTDSRPSR